MNNLLLYVKKKEKEINQNANNENIINIKNSKQKIKKQKVFI